MLTFFKKFFKTEEKDVNLSELNNWLDKRFSSEIEELKNNLKDIKDLKDEVQKNLEMLDAVDIQEKKAEERVKTIVAGNIPAYTNAVRLFLKRIEVPKEIDSKSIEEFHEFFEKELDGLNKRTFRNFQIIRELVGKELENVVRAIKKMEEKLKSVKNESSFLKNLEKVKEDAESILVNIQNKEKNSLKITELTEEIQNLEKRIEQIEKQIKDAERSDKAQELKKQEKEKEKFEAKLRDIKNEVINLFSPLQKALKKYNNMCYIQKVDAYIHEPVETLLKDSELEIIKFLKDILKMIEDKKIDLKDEKKYKSLNALSKLNESFFKEFIKEYSDLTKKIREVEERISSNDIENVIAGLKYDLRNQIQMKDELQKEIDKIKDVNIEKEVKELESHLRRLIGSEVRLKNVMG